MAPLPRVLAGPIIRRVELDSCSFWIALSEPATVTVVLYRGGAVSTQDAVSLQPVGGAQVAARRISAGLHIAVVTVDLSSTQSLTPGDAYSYDVRFKLTGGQTSDLKQERLLENETASPRIAGVDKDAPFHLALGFTENTLPSFLAPPTKFAPASPATIGSGLRMAHCSCRRPGAAAVDAMAALVPLIRSDERPHQLFLTGDQIYADDVATPFLPVVTSLAADLLGGAQSLPGLPADPRKDGKPANPINLAGTAANLPPMQRKWLLWQLAGFTGADTENHLITFPEFVAHHLLAWSSRAWRAIPEFTKVFTSSAPSKPAAELTPWLNKPWFCGDSVDAESPEATLRSAWANKEVNKDAFKNFNSTAHHVVRYAATAPLAAQVLANTPTYMIFDDHEVADDWNLNGRWFARVYREKKEWGRFVVRNGLTAYALMQGWGNDPKAFEAAAPGGQLLSAIAAAVSPGASPSSSNAAKIDVLLGFDAPTTAVPKRVDWSYSLVNPGADYSTVVLDTRTRRDVNNLSLRPPNLVTNLDAQLPAKPATSTEKLLVLVSAAPVIGPVVLDQVGQPVAQTIIDLVHHSKLGEVPGFAPGDELDKKSAAGCGDRSARGAEEYDREGWAATEEGLEALLARLATYGSVVVLSGDVHYSGSLQLDFFAKGAPTPSRLVQCTSSPTKNVFKAEVEEVVRNVGNLQRVLEVPVERLAWKQIAVTDLVPAGARVSLARRMRIKRQPALVPTRRWPKNSKIPAGKQPDWRWRMVPLLDAKTVLPEDLRPVEIGGSDSPSGTAPDIDHLTEVAAAHQKRLAEGKPLLRRLVFAPNVGTVHFEEAAGGVEVVHRLHTTTKVPQFAAKGSTEPPTGPPKTTIPTFGPHTVHRTPIRTPAGVDPPVIVPDT